MNRKTEKDLTRNLIIEMATALFLEKGFEKASMEEVCKKCNISKGGLYHHFTGKDELLYAVSARLSEPIAALFEQVMVLENPLEGLEFYITSYLKYYHEHPREAEFFMLSMNKSANSPAMQEFYAQGFESVSEFIASLYQQAINLGYMNPFETMAVAISLMTSLDGMTGYLQIIGDRLPLGTIVNGFKTSFIKPYLK